MLHYYLFQNIYLPAYVCLSVGILKTLQTQKCSERVRNSRLDFVGDLRRIQNLLALFNITKCYVMAV